MASAKDIAAAKAEVKRNSAAYKKMRGELVAKYDGKTALFSKGEFIQAYDTIVDAYKAGVRKYGKGKFSVRRISTEPLDLGIVGHLIALSQLKKQLGLS